MGQNPSGEVGQFPSGVSTLDVRDLKFVPEGLEAFVRRSKTDQEAEGFTKVIAYGSDPATCPVRLFVQQLRLWLGQKISSFKSINLILQRLLPATPWSMHIASTVALTVVPLR